ncbi:hypothetical protein LAZ67_19001828 [Cordylochernes scorpioides]|uniref:DUF5641 domain-containing protein n=1 Tax=Cordylochernes scorpioides TaxID=51811 RepID=A0ABY6LKK7_9ARAC|nr:hypothetical protein LAZ67_19001828 [Cordylochernes scorpioides]
MEPNAVVVNYEVAETFRGAPYLPMLNAVTVSSLKMRPYSISIVKIRRKWPHLNKFKARDLKNVVPELIIGINNLRLILHRELALGPPDAPIGWRIPLGRTVGGNFDDLMETQGWGMNQVEGRAYVILQRTTKRTGACWETGLLWRNAEGTLPESYQMTLGRLRRTERKLEKDTLLLAAYKAKFDEYLEKGYIRKLESIESLKEVSGRARSNGVSLNEALSKGSDLIRPLTSVLWNFRAHNIALIGDITHMFHRVRVIKEDQCSHRFLWRKMDTSIELDHYEMQNENAMQHELVNLKCDHTLVNDFYVDDCLTGADSEENCMDLKSELSEVNADGGFYLSNFNSNSRAFIESIPEGLRAKGEKYLNEKSVIPAGNVLEILEGAVATKRQACSLVMSVYDPLGLVNPFKIKGIIIFQRTWIAGIGWDEELTPDIYAAWKLWLSKLKEIHLVQVPRFYHPDLLSRSIIRQVEAQTFVDASQKAFSAVTYLQVETRNGNITTTLFGSKAKVAPLKKLTIPNLELQGYVLETRFAVLLSSELRLPKSRRDPGSDKRNRLCGRWVPKSENPADIATRFEKYISFEPTDMWYTGPEFLKRAEEEWPREAKGKDFGTILVTRMLNLGDDSRVSPYSEVECGRESGKLIRKISQRLLPEKKFETFGDIEICVMVVWKTAKLGRTRRKLSMENNKVRQHKFTISPEEYRSAVTTLVQWEQTESFPREIAELAKGRIVKKTKIARLSPCLINRTICLKSRILQANKVPAEQKTYAILPSNHHVTELLIQAENERCAHQAMGYHFNVPLHSSHPSGSGARLEYRGIHDGLSRFIDTRGRPDTIYSDNGTNFMGASKELKLEASEIDFEVMPASRSFGPIKWNPPAAPHFGGAWERLIKSVKKCLRATLNEVNPKDITLLIAFSSGSNGLGRYIPKLMPRSKWHHQTEPIITGDLFFLVDELHPRNMWKRGFVSYVHFGPDGQVRVATITTKHNGKADGEFSSTSLHLGRPFTVLTKYRQSWSRQSGKLGNVHTKDEDTVTLRKFHEQIKVELGAKDGDGRVLTGLHGR